ncbi:MAG: 50S ribosomal protein L17 [Syntrophorhabdus sp. PtaB.Bin047]|nr:MAG: 50S ribosomal protein L17 [Syntrophorhabdus sp. PtaB.Bin047]
MRHQNRVKKMNRTKSHRRALFMNLANALFDHESIKTTNPKAMELKKVADRLITLAKRKDLHSLRLAFAFLRDKKVVRKLFSDIGDRYAAISGGYTRVVKIGLRKGDAAPMAIIELTQKKEPEKEKEKGKAKEKKEAKPPKSEKPVKEKKEKAPAKKKAAPKKEAAVGEEPKPKRTRKPKAEKKAEETPEGTQDA